jgi:hypothetical protein
MIRDVLVATLTTLETIGIVTGVVAGLGTLLFAAVNAWLSISNERKRTQPIVMAHQEGNRRFVQDSRKHAVDTYLTNEGSGAAFNVRFGVEFHGIRLPYKYSPGDHPAGSVYRVLGAGKRLPEQGSWPLEIDPLILLSKIADPDATRMFWARYENAQGKLWETRNPGDRSERLDIKRVRVRRFHEWWEERQRRKALARAAENEQNAAHGLLTQEPRDAPEAPQDPPLAS